jgi:hypothetical protein
MSKNSEIITRLKEIDEEFEVIRLKNPIVYHSMMLTEMSNIPLTHALKVCILELVKQRDQLQLEVTSIRLREPGNWNEAETKSKE